MDEISDKELVEQYLKGDEKSFEILVKRYLKPIYVFISRYLRNRFDIEDIVQEIFLKVWRNINKFDQEKKFKTWIFTIAKNTALDFLKKKKTIPFAAFENEGGENFIENKSFDSLMPLDKVVERKDLMDKLFSAIEKLPPKYSQILFFYYGNGFTFQEISEIFGQPLNTIKSRHKRAIAILKKLFPDLLDL